MKKKTIVIIVALAMMVAVFVGCNTSESEDVNAEPSIEVATNDDKNITTPNDEIEEFTIEEENCIESMISYLEAMPFSKTGIKEQLIFEGYPEDTVEKIVEMFSSAVDWNAMAEAEANDYLDLMPFSKDGLYEQLIFEGFTEEEATYAVDKVYQ